MECKVEVTHASDVEHAIWAKAITGVDLSSLGGFALEGKWLNCSPDSTIQCLSTGRKSRYKVDTTANIPIVISVSFVEPSSSSPNPSYRPPVTEVKKSIEKLDQVVFLVKPEDGVGHMPSPYQSPFGTASVACKDASLIDMFGRLVNAGMVVQLDGKGTNNPNYKAAARLVAEGLMLDKSGGAKTMVYPAKKAEELPEIKNGNGSVIEPYGRQSIRYGKRIIKLPSGCKFMFELEPSGVWVIGMNGKLVLADCLVDFNTTDENLVWFLEDQAARMENAVVTNRIIALAKKKGE